MKKKCFISVIFVLSLLLNLYSNENLKEFVYEYNIQEAIYFKIAFILSDSTYQKYFIKDDLDTVWQCYGNYKFTDSLFIRTNRTCQFVRQEEPKAPEKYPDLILRAKNVSQNKFTILIEENDGEKILNNSGEAITNEWVTFELIED